MLILSALGGVLEVGAHALAQEHGVMALEHPLAGAMPYCTRPLVRLELVDRGVVGQFEQDHVVEVPPVRGVVPAEELDAEIRLVTLDLSREDLAHEELEERVTTAADGEESRQDGHGSQ